MTDSLRARAEQLANEFTQVRPDDPPDCGLRESAEVLAAVIEAEVLRQRLEEAKWWHERFSTQPEPRYGCCQRIADLQRQLAEMEGKS